MKIEMISSNYQAKESIDLNTCKLQPEAIRLILLSAENRTLRAEMAVLHDMLATQEKEATSRKRIVLLPADPDPIRQAINDNNTPYVDVEEQLSNVISQPAVKETEATVEDIPDAPLVRYPDLILTEAVKERVPDIPIESQANHLRVHYCIDSVLKDAGLPPKTIPTLISS